MNNITLNIRVSFRFSSFHHTRLHGDVYDTDRLDTSITLIFLQLPMVNMVLMWHNLLYNMLLVCVLILLLCMCPHTVTVYVISVSSYLYYRFVLIPRLKAGTVEIESGDFNVCNAV